MSKHVYKKPSEDRAGARPDDYLLIHKVEGGVRVQVCTHYVNHSGDWCPAPGGHPVTLRWPKGKGVSKFVAVGLGEL